VDESSNKPVKRKRVTQKKQAAAIKQENDAEEGSSSDLSEVDAANTDTEVKPVSLSRSRKLDGAGC
jgi:hypothetical protein